MRAVLQRVKESRVSVDGRIVGNISAGLNILVGIEKGDTEEELAYAAAKILSMRIFDDKDGRMNLSVRDIKGEILVISQFTLYGDCRRGNRPSFERAAPGNEAEKLYGKFVDMLKNGGLKVETGIFGADMEVNIVNDGPVTIILERKAKE
ncbi:MAG: D-tyrosyl-tRNA(Tyr) deacylase [Oscillospiraceae bacterium]|nr:D-tyrosyl-tRNA(Tyr) deacylase [Oscillospiraceae bacterium]